MRYSLLSLLFIALISSMVMSCAPSNKYGSKSRKYSNGRSRSMNKKPYEKNERVYGDAKKQPKDAKKTTESKDKTYRVYESKSLTAEDQKRDEMVSTAKQYLGIPYKSAGKTPSEGFDCSGFANFVFTQNGFTSSGPSHELAKKGEHRDQKDLKPGDLVFFGSENRISHVGMVTQNSLEKTFFIHSSSTSGIKIDEINGSEYWRSRYLFGRDLLAERVQARWVNGKP